MKERIKGAFTKRKILHFLKMALFVVALSLILLSLLGTVAHATGLVDDTINAENLYSKYPLSNYQLDFYVDNSWSWLPWNWLDGIGKIGTVRAFTALPILSDDKPLFKQCYGLCGAGSL